MHTHALASLHLALLTSNNSISTEAWEGWMEVEQDRGRQRIGRPMGGQEQGRGGNRILYLGWILTPVLRLFWAVQNCAGDFAGGALSSPILMPVVLKLLKLSRRV